MWALSRNITSSRSAVADVVRIGPPKPSFVSFGSNPLWSICACVSSTKSSERGLKAKG
jgi:hypothetical protein